MKSFGEKLRDIRSRRGLKQTELGKMLGVSSRMIIDYENGTRHPHRKRLIEFAEILEVPTEYLLDDCFEQAEEVYRERGDAEKREETPHESEAELQARRELAFLRERTTALFAGGALPQDVKDAFFQSLYDAYLKCRTQAIENGVDVTKFDY